MIQRLRCSCGVGLLIPSGWTVFRCWVCKVIHTRPEAVIVNGRRLSP